VLTVFGVGYRLAEEAELPPATSSRP
jgi:hypothetical protein